jgi:plasmid stabilization system protein ParE
MKYQILLSLRAAADINSAVRWYLQTDPILALRFLTEIRASLRRVRAMPNAFPLRGRVLRCAFIRRFPYLIYYYVRLNVVSINAVLHERRSDRP